MGDQQNVSPQEWRDREAFYTRLVQFTTQHGHPLTDQPTVSKTPMDLFQLYQEVRRRGGFEKVSPTFGGVYSGHKMILVPLPLSREEKPLVLTNPRMFITLAQI